MKIQKYIISAIACTRQDGERNGSRKKRRETAIWQRCNWEHLIRDEEVFD